RCRRRLVAIEGSDELLRFLRGDLALGKHVEDVLALFVHDNSFCYRILTSTAVRPSWTSTRVPGNAQNSRQPAANSCITGIRYTRPAMAATSAARIRNGESTSATGSTGTQIRMGRPSGRLIRTVNSCGITCDPPIRTMPAAR